MYKIWSIASLRPFQNSDGASDRQHLENIINTNDSDDNNAYGDAIAKQ